MEPGCDTGTVADDEQRNLRELVRRLVEDFKAVAHDEAALARVEMRYVAKSAVRAGVAILSGVVVALIGLGLLCGTAVAALEPVVAPLWLRMLILAVVYMAGGASLTLLFARKLRKNVRSSLSRTRDEARKTAEAVKQSLQEEQP